jgi:hypothetical protein
MGWATVQRLAGHTAQVMLYNDGIAGERLGVLGWSIQWPSGISAPVPRLISGFSGTLATDTSDTASPFDLPLGQIYADNFGPAVPGVPLFSMGPQTTMLTQLWRSPKLIVPPGYSFIWQTFQTNLTMTAAFWWIVYDRAG